MFQNSYQNGTYFDLFDPKNSADKLKLLYRTVNTNANNKVFDKDLKTFVLQFTSPNSKIILPKEDKKDLYLIQQFLVFQIYFFPGMSWNIQLTISDLTKTKRRIMLSPSTHKVQIKPFFVKIPCLNFTEGLWNNFAVDLYSFIQAFKGQTYRSLDSICISGHFKVRRIYTSTSEPLECQGQNQSQQIKQISFLPKNYYFPQGVQYVTKLTKYILEYIQEAASQASESTTIKQSSVTKHNKLKTGAEVPRPQKSFEIKKNQKHLKEKEVRYQQNVKKSDFLANTNGTEILKKMKKQESSDNDLSQGNCSNNFGKNSKSRQKTVKKKLTKTQQIPPKPRTSLQAYTVVPKKGVKNESTKGKINPWRSNKIQQIGYTDTSHVETSHQYDSYKAKTPQTASMVKTKLNTGKNFSDTKNMAFDKRSSDQYSDSQYVQLSQKFSTLTDGKFFKNELMNNCSNHEIHRNQEQEQIQENIQMQTNSVHSDHQKPQQKRTIQNVQINQSISDSLERFNQQKIEQKIQKIGRSSLYGFGQQLMKRFMGQIQRPYSPPIGEREVTQEQVSQNHNIKEQVELIYDPVLNCYYDPRTHTYYQLKG